MSTVSPMVRNLRIRRLGAGCQKGGPWPSRSTRAPARAVWLGLLVLFGSLFPLSDLSAQQDDPAELATAVEQAYQRAIEKASPSVVAIARVRVDGGGMAGQDLPPDLMMRMPQMRAFLPAHRRLEPTDPAFIPNGFGSGVAIDRAGLILTNYHVLGDPKQNDHYVFIDRKPYPARIKAEDPWLDLAVLEIEAGDLTPITFGETKDLARGQSTLVLGNPYAIARDGQASAARGMIANLSRTAPPVASAGDPNGERPTLHHYGKLIQIDTQLNIGHSGGALVNLRGEMIGLTTSQVALEGYDDAGGYAIAVDDAFLRAVEQLKQGKAVQYGFLGVAPAALTADERRQGRSGARVELVMTGTPAAAAGLVRGDVITYVEDTPVDDDLALIRLLGGRPADSSVTLTVRRGSDFRRVGTSLKREVQLAKKYMEAPREVISQVPDPQWRGMRIDFATALPNFRERHHAIDLDGCVAVTSVARDSAAWKADLRPSVFISHVGRQRVHTPAEFFAAVSDRTDAVSITLTEEINGSRKRTIAP
jgi:serine protease Do